MLNSVIAYEDELYKDFRESKGIACYVLITYSGGVFWQVQQMSKKY